MSDITKIDENFNIKTNIEKEDICFYDAYSKPFSVYGVFKENGIYRRMPERVAKSVSDGVEYLHINTAGGRVRFITDSFYVAIHSEKQMNYSNMNHFAFSGVCGFDLYVDGIHQKALIPPQDMKDGYESVFDFEDKKLREITIYFPLYSGVGDLHIGLEKDAVINEASPYVNEKPVVYYGSSITQGGCASRAGMSYQTVISRRFNCDFVNLGFSGSAKAEDAIIEYIKNLDMSLFVYDYDHNAPTVEHLEKTHWKMFEAIRKANPDLPIIMMPRPKLYLNDDEIKRRSIIERTYKKAVSLGDKNVYYIDNRELTALCGSEGTVDGCHPTDFGFASMAKAVGDDIEKINIFK